MSAIFARRLAQCPTLWERLWVVIDAVLDTLRNAPVIHLGILRQDVRFAVRTLVRMPLFSATVVLVAALGIGANGCVFSRRSRPAPPAAV